MDYEGQATLESPAKNFATSGTASAGLGEVPEAPGVISVMTMFAVAAATLPTAVLLSARKRPLG